MKRIITGLIILLVLCGVVAGAYFLIKGNDKKKNSNSDSNVNKENIVEVGTYLLVSYEENGTKYTGAQLKNQLKKQYSLRVKEDGVVFRTTITDETGKNTYKVNNYSYTNEYINKTDSDEHVYSYTYDKEEKYLVLTKVDENIIIKFKKSNI